jgi:hypothetical protein
VFNNDYECDGSREEAVRQKCEQTLMSCSQTVLSNLDATPPEVALVIDPPAEAPHMMCQDADTQSDEALRESARLTCDNTKTMDTMLTDAVSDASSVSPEARVHVVSAADSAPYPFECHSSAAEDSALTGGMHLSGMVEQAEVQPSTCGGPVASTGDSSIANITPSKSSRKQLLSHSKTQATLGKFSASRKEGKTPSPDKDCKGFLHCLMAEDVQHKTLMTFLPRMIPKSVHHQMSVISQGSRKGRTTHASALLNDWRFEVSRFIVFIIDMMLLAWNIQAAALLLEQNPDEVETGVPDFLVFVLANDVLACLHGAEWLLQIYVERCRCCDSVFRQSINTCIMVSHIAQAVSQHTHPGQRGHSEFRIWATRLAMFRVIRIFQLLKLTSFVSNLSFLKELRCMVYSLTGAIWSLLWSSLMVFVLLLMFGMFFTEGTITYRVQHQHHETKEGEAMPLRDNFGTLTRTLLSLFKAISGGDDWGNTYDSLEPLGKWYRLLFLGFIAFSVIALLNVVTAVFVESTMERSQNDRDLMTQKEMITKKEFLDRMQNVFAELDDDNDNSINVEELSERMMDPKIGAYFGSLGVDVAQVGKLFALLDTDQSGSIDKDEFMFGCLRLKGEAKSLDVAILHGEMRLVRRNIDDLGSMIEDLLEDMVGLTSARSCSSHGGSTSSGEAQSSKPAL